MLTKSTLVALGLLIAGSANAATIGFSSPNFDDNYQTLVRGAAQKEAEKLGYKIQIEDAREDVGTQLSQIQNFIASGVDAIVLSPVSTQATPQITKLAAQAGIPLVYVIRRPADVEKFGPKAAYVGSNNLQAGKLEGEAVCKMTGGKGTAVMLIGFLRNEDAQNRTQAVKDVLGTPACSGIKIIAEQEGEWQRTKANDIVAGWLASGKKFDIVFANNDEMALGAIQALKAVGADMKNVTVAGVDATADALAAMKAGDLDITVFQDAVGQGTGSVDAASKMMKGETVPKYIEIPFQTVTQDNMSGFMK